MREPGVDESFVSEFCNITLPLAASGLLLLYAFFSDLSGGTQQLVQRAGTVLIVVGAYVSFRQLKWSMRYVNGNLYINNELWYGKWGFVYVVLGTLLSGYGDLIIAQFKQI